MATNGDDLTSEQMDKLLQFQDLTGIDDFNTCRNILNSHAWNLESAAHDQFNEPAPSSPPLPQVLNANPSNQRIIVVPRRNPSLTWFGWAYEMLLFPVRFFYSSLFSIARFVFLFLRPRPRITDREGEIDMREFIEKFEETYGSQHPPLYQGTYVQALNEAKRELRFMLVYLHSQSHQNVPQFVRNTLCSTEFKELLTSNNILFWACSVDLAEGYKVSQYIRESTYPFLAFIVLKDNRMTVVARIEGNHNKDDLVAELNDLITTQRPSLARVQRERDERNLTVTLRQQQDEAYQLSLLADQEKERKKKEKELEEQNVKRKKMEEEKKKLLFEQRKAEEVDRLKAFLRDRLPQEPDNNHPSAIRVLFKLPSGRRLERSFKKEEKLQLLYDFLLVHESCPDNFQIFTPHPRQLIPSFNYLEYFQKETSDFSHCSPNNNEENTFVKSKISNDRLLDRNMLADQECTTSSSHSGANLKEMLNSVEVKRELDNIPTFDEFGFQKAQMLHVHDVNS